MKKFLVMIALVLQASASWAQGTTLTLTLQECRQMALEHDEQLKVMDNKQQQAEIDKQVAFINYLPTISASVVGLYQPNSQETMGMKIVMHGMYMAGITLQQTIYAGGRVHAGNDLALIGKQVAMENLRKTRMQVISDVDNAYWSLVSVLKKIEMLESYQQYMAELSKTVQVSVDADMAIQNDVLRVDAGKSEIDYNLQKAKNGAQLCSLMLSNVLGLGLDTEVIPAEKDLNIQEPTDLAEDISALPEISMMQHGIAAKEKQVKMTRGENLPSVVGMASYSRMGNLKLEGQTQVDGVAVPISQDIKNSGSMLGVMVSIPISSWYGGSKKIKKAKLDVENARLEMQRNTRLLEIQARNAIQNVQNGYLQIQTAQTGAQQGDENLRVMRERYDAGMATLTDLLDAQRQGQQAQSNLIEAKSQYLIYQTEYLKAVGRLE